MHGEGVYRTAPATPGLLIIEQKIVQRCENNIDADACKAF